jgi:N-ethylmaleimide reductase
VPDRNVLFTPLRAGELELPNRVVMAAVSRGRVDAAGVPSALAALYYGQRAAAGLVTSEAIHPHPAGRGATRSAGIRTPAQQAAWQRITAAVHGIRGRIVAQLLHAGRLGNAMLLPGERLVGPSARRAPGGPWIPGGGTQWDVPEALTTTGIADVIADYAAAAVGARAAGFDAVELHVGAGSLPGQFLCPEANARTDAYGGDDAGRARFVLELLAALVEAVGPGRLAVKLTPDVGWHGLVDATPRDTWAYLVRTLNGFPLAYLHVVQLRPGTDYHRLCRLLYDGVYLAGGGLTPEGARQAVTVGEADAVAFGRAFVANPDLPTRLRHGLPLAEPDPSTWFAEGPEGYIDYPPARGALPAGAGS